MNATLNDLRPTIVPRSDQTNADDLIAGPKTVHVVDVTIGTSEEQPISIHYEGADGRPYKPCKTMRRVLICGWGPDGNDWIGRSMTLFHEPRVRFGGDEVGGIRISHMSDIERDIEVRLTATRGKKALHVIKRLQVDNGPPLADVLAAIQSAANKAGMDNAKALASALKRPADIAEAQAAYKARAAELKAQAAPKPAAKTLEQFRQDIDNAADEAAAQAVLDAARPVLSADDLAELQNAFAMAWSA